MSTGNAAFGDLLWRADEEEVAGTVPARAWAPGSENARGWILRPQTAMNNPSSWEPPNHEKTDNARAIPQDRSE